VQNATIHALGPHAEEMQDRAKIARYDRYLKFAYQQADRAVARIADVAGRGSNIIHGMAPFHTQVSMTNILKNAGIDTSLSPGFGNVPDLELEDIYEDQVKTFVRYQTKVAARAILQNPAVIRPTRSTDRVTANAGRLHIVPSPLLSSTAAAGPLARSDACAVRCGASSVPALP
jgi:hypothetical protein